MGGALSEPRSASFGIPGYDLVERLGRGGSSTVYRARQLSLDRDVALKVLFTDLGTEAERRRFDRERRALSSLSNHAHVVDVYDAGVAADGRPFIVMRIYARGSFADRVKQSGPLALRDVGRVVGGVASALEAAHALGVIHRDVTPSNVLIGDDGEPLLADFGIAALLDVGEGTRTFAFTTAHAAPEVLRDNNYSIASDVYSLASTTYFLITGRPPFADAGRGPQAHVTSPDPLGDGVPPAAAAVILRGLAADPAVRPPSAREFASELQATLAELPDPQPRPDDERAPGDERLTDAPPEVVPSEVVPSEVVPSEVGITGETTVLNAEDSDEVTRRRDDAEPEPPAGEPPEPAELVVRRRRSRRRLVGVAAMGLAVIVACGLVLGLVERHTYGVKDRDGVVAIQRGAWLPLLVSYEKTSVPTSALPLALRQRLKDRVSVEDRSAAEALVGQYEDAAAYCVNNLDRGCPEHPPRAPTLDLSVDEYPHGKRLRLLWDVIPQRGTVTTVSLSKAALGDCPPVLEGRGECTIEGEYATTYTATAVTRALSGALSDTVEAEVRTYDKPSLKVRPGDKFKDDGERYCTVDVVVRGLKPDTRYPVKLSFPNGAKEKTSIETDSSGGSSSGTEDGWGYTGVSGTKHIAATVAGMTARSRPWVCR
ncbi:serine/threonine-protein kinase [Spongisporangium articulatum]|uniref:non-specific serine/threonine protein kinase n=1 Tax=Spongisporangium articulatum TaxID=3362603 RepID=A0ABW8AU72_9ACTN